MEKTSSLVRLMRCTFENDFLSLIFLFPDDWLVRSWRSRRKEGTVLPLFLFRVLGVPIKWKTVEAGFKVDWMGPEYADRCVRQAIGIMQFAFGDLCGIGCSWRLFFDVHCDLPNGSDCHFAMLRESSYDYGRLEQRRHALFRVDAWAMGGDVAIGG